MILQGLLNSIKTIVTDTASDVTTLLGRLTSARAGYMDNMQYWPQAKANLLDKQVSLVGLKSVQVVSGTIDVSASFFNDHSIAAIDQSKTFPILYARNVGRTSTDANGIATVEFTSNTNVRIEVSAGGSTSASNDLIYTCWIVEGY